MCSLPKGEYMPRNKDGNSYFGPSALVLLVTIFTIIFVVFNFGNAANMNASYAAVIALQLFLYGASAAIYMSLRGSALWEKLNFRPSNIRNIGVTLVVTVIVILLSVIMKFVIFLPGRDYFMFSFFTSSFDIRLNSFSDWIVITSSFVLIPALGKEFLFRSIVYSEFRSLGVLCSVVITSVLYAFILYFQFCGHILHMLRTRLYGLSFLTYCAISILFSARNMYGRFRQIPTEGSCSGSLQYLFCCSWYSYCLQFLNTNTGKWAKKQRSKKMSPYRTQLTTGRRHFCLSQYL